MRNENGAVQIRHGFDRAKPQRYNEMKQWFDVVTLPFRMFVFVDLVCGSCNLLATFSRRSIYIKCVYNTQHTVFSLVPRWYKHNPHTNVHSWCKLDASPLPQPQQRLCQCCCCLCRRRHHRHTVCMRSHVYLYAFSRITHQNKRIATHSLASTHSHIRLARPLVRSFVQCEFNVSSNIPHSRVKR